MYTSYFGLHETPFSIAPDPLYLYMSEHHREALAHLQYGIKSDGGFVLLTGEVGAGKTTLCRSLLEQLPEDVVVAYVLNPKVSVIELLETICDELRIERPGQGSIKELVDRLNAYLLEANARGRKTVLIIDEAQNLSVDVLEQLRLLTNLETNRYKLLQIVLLGQPELLQILNRKEMRQLSQRVTARCHLGSLDVEDVAAYVQHRLKIAGCDRQVFPPALFKTLWQLTDGIPRLINLVCDRALLGAYVLERKEVDREILQQAAREVLGDSQPRRKPSPSALPALLIVAAVLLIVTALWSWQSTLEAKQDSLNAGQKASKPEQLVTVEPVVNENIVAQQQPSPPTTSTTVAESVNEPLPVLWPQGFGTDQNLEDAFVDLAGLWGVSYPETRPGACSFASENGLSCLARKDSLVTLQGLNRPAILTLYNDDGTPFRVVVSHLDDEQATFIANGEVKTLSIAAIESRWFGDYLLLWQRPQQLKSFLRPGQTGDAVVWLAESLQELGLYRASGGEVRLEGALLGAFKKFQFDSGLTPDGILGSMSLIHLNTALEVPGPRLNQRGDS